MIDSPAPISSFAELPGTWPDPATLAAIEQDEGFSIAKDVFSAMVNMFTAPQDIASKAIEDLFLEDSFWRDHVALTWSLRTFNTRETIANQIPAFMKAVKIEPNSLKLAEDAVAVVPVPTGISVVRMPVTFNTSAPAAACTAVIKLVKTKQGHVRIFTITTALQELHVSPWKSLEVRQEAKDTTASAQLPKVLDVLVVGAGHAGLTISAYFKALGLSFATIDKYEEIGDNWALRYDSATLHTTKRYSELPYLPYPKEWPTYLPKQNLADFYKRYVQAFGLPVYTHRACQTITWDSDQNCWDVTIVGPNGEEHVRVKSLVFATGIGGHAPYIPDLPQREFFERPVMHSVQYKNASTWKDKQVIVVGASTTGCDVALDATKAGAASVTLVQRGEIRLYPQAHIGILSEMVWSDTMPIELCDTLASEDPLKLGADLASGLMAHLDTQLDPDYYDGLRRAGFRIKTVGPPAEQVLCHAGRHYMDVGACEAIRKGLITVKSDSVIQAFTKDGLSFKDGSEITADIICFATGFEKDSRKTLSSVIGDVECSKLQPIWGVDSEGEVRGAWRPSGRDHLWFHGGDTMTQRYYGKFLAMQVAAEIAGVRPKRST